MADEQGQNGHGGKRPGAGRKPKAEQFADETQSVNDKIAAKLDPIFDALLLLALGGAEREEREYMAAGMCAVEKHQDILDSDGNPTGKVAKWKEPAFPNLTAESMVLVKRKVVTLEPDTKAAIYLMDRILGKPAGEDELDAYESVIEEIQSRLLSALEGLDADAREAIKAQLRR